MIALVLIALASVPVPTFADDLAPASETRAAPIEHAWLDIDCRDGDNALPLFQRAALSNGDLSAAEAASSGSLAARVTTMLVACQRPANIE